MKRILTVFIGLSLALAVVSFGFAAVDCPTAKATVITGLASMPLAFTENQGQWDARVLYRANAGGATMWFTKDGAYYQFTHRVPRTGERGWQMSTSALPSIDIRPIRRAKVSLDSA